MANDLTPADEPEALDAYSLLSKPTLSLTDEQVGRIVADLRDRRARHLRLGKPDKPASERKVKSPTAKLTAEDRARNSRELMASMGLSLNLPGLD